MPNLPTPLLRITAMMLLIGGLTFAGASYADTPEQPDQTADQASAPAMKMQHASKAMAQNVEKRIKTLHEKLGITSAQEPKWTAVAQTMRDNENDISLMMKQRFENRKSMTAIDDLQSYQAIAEAHTEGLKKLIPVFQSLYNDMTDDQKKDADEAFGRFEGHRGEKAVKKHE